MFSNCSATRLFMTDDAMHRTIASPPVIETNNLLKWFKSHLLSPFGIYGMHRCASLAVSALLGTDAALDGREVLQVEPKEKRALGFD